MIQHSKELHNHFHYSNGIYVQFSALLEKTRFASTALLIRMAGFPFRSFSKCPKTSTTMFVCCILQPGCLSFSSFLTDLYSCLIVFVSSCIVALCVPPTRAVHFQEVNLRLCNVNSTDIRPTAFPSSGGLLSFFLFFFLWFFWCH